jgi:hypothetical protein
MNTRPVSCTTRSIYQISTKIRLQDLEVECSTVLRIFPLVNIESADNPEGALNRLFMSPFEYVRYVPADARAQVSNSRLPIARTGESERDGPSLRLV